MLSEADSIRKKDEEKGNDVEGVTGGKGMRPSGKGTRQRMRKSKGEGRERNRTVEEAMEENACAKKKDKGRG